MARVVVSLRLPEELVARVDAACGRGRRSAWAEGVFEGALAAGSAAGEFGPVEVHRHSEAELVALSGVPASGAGRAAAFRLMTARRSG